MEERLQKIIAQAGICSRRKAEKLIEAGKVWVNGNRSEIGDKADSSRDQIEVLGRRLFRKKKVYFVLNKPKEYLSENKSEWGKKNIYSLPSVNSIGFKVMHVGRLDFMSEGLLLLTNDGDFANQVMHPRYQLTKTYYVKAEPAFTDDDFRKLEEGVVLDGEEVECVVNKISKYEIEITLHEGQNRIVRRIIEALGKKVFRLVRIAIGNLEIDNLREGQVRELTDKEIRDLTRTRR